MDPSAPTYLPIRGVQPVRRVQPIELLMINRIKDVIKYHWGWVSPKFLGLCVIMKDVLPQNVKIGKAELIKILRSSIDNYKEEYNRHTAFIEEMQNIDISDVIGVATALARCTEKLVCVISNLMCGENNPVPRVLSWWLTGDGCHKFASLLYQRFKLCGNGIIADRLQDLVHFSSCASQAAEVRGVGMAARIERCVLEARSIFLSPKIVGQMAA